MILSIVHFSFIIKCNAALFAIVVKFANGRVAAHIFCFQLIAVANVTSIFAGCDWFRHSFICADLIYLQKL